MSTQSSAVQQLDHIIKFALDISMNFVPADKQDSFCDSIKSKEPQIWASYDFKPSN